MAEPTLDTLLIGESLGRTQDTLPLDDPHGLRTWPGGEREPDLGVERGAQIGRYLILSKLGAGAMGVVFSAYDPNLDRKIALKLLAPRSGASSTAQVRLLREAQAMAKLNHGNVVGVHDVGIHGGRVFVAMEFVRGQTLREWLAVEGGRSWREVVEVFLAAGRGLAAAHAQGLVHRDFKPDNVMIGDDGRVRVMDFGLARSKDGAEPEPEPGSSIVGAGEQALERSLTQTGALLGTPAYMAPEQLERREADALSDQFGFCVALYEGLYGERPFRGETFTELRDAVIRGELGEAPRGAEVPSWLRELLVRGLASAPADRFASMDELLARLTPRRRHRYRRRLIAATITTALLGLGLVYECSVDRSPKICAGMDAKLAGVWDESRREQVRGALAATDSALAAQTRARVGAGLDAYASAWVSARTSTCEATVRGEQSAQLLDLRMACLDRALLELEATVDALAVADETVAREAAGAVASLPALAGCDDLERLQAEAPLPEDPSARARVLAHERELAIADAHLRTGKYADGLAVVEAAAGELEALDYAPLAPRSWLLRGELQSQLGRYEDAVASLERAYRLAVERRMTAEAAGASSLLVFVLGHRLARVEAARAWTIHAESLARASEDEAQLAEYFYELGMLEYSAGDYAAALAAHEQAQGLFAAALGSGSERVAVALNGVALASQAMGRSDEARAAYEAAREIFEDLLGESHPSTAHVLNNLGVLRVNLGEYERARTDLLRALELRELALGPEHPDVVQTLANLADLELRAGEVAQARSHAARALEIALATVGAEHGETARAYSLLARVAHADGDHELALQHSELALEIDERVVGPGHVGLASSLEGVGAARRELGDHAGARAQFERMREVLVAAYGPDHALIGYAEMNLGSVARAAGDADEAIARYERAVELHAEALAKDDPVRAWALVGLGGALVDAGRAAEAVAALERALQLRSASEVAPAELARTRFELGRALWAAPPAQGRDRARALELVERAREVFAAGGPGLGDELVALDEWSRSRGE